jgi:hypothetical protein
MGTGTLELVVETDELYNLIFASVHCSEVLRLLTVEQFAARQRWNF